MSPEEAAEAIKHLEGVTDASVKRTHAGKFKSISVQYANGGVAIGDLRAAISTEFDTDKLTNVTLTSNACASIMTAQLKVLADSLREKYPQHVTETVVDANGVKTGTLYAFWNPTTRVEVGYQVNVSEAVHTTGKFSGIANALADAGQAAAEAACPNNPNGATITATFQYSSETAFEARYAADQQARKAKAESTKNAL